MSKKTKNKEANAEENSAAKLMIVIAIIIAIVAVYFIMTSTIKDKPLAGRGSELDRAAGVVDIGGDFELMNQNGELFGSRDLKGKPYLIYFGFSFCPDICPTSLNKMAKVIDTLSKYNISITPVFVSLDPERDTPEVLKKYLATFGDKFVGLTGRPADIKKVADEFKVYYAKASSSNKSDKEYVLDHTSLIYVMDKEGKYMKHFHLDTPAEEMVEYLRVNAK